MNIFDFGNFWNTEGYPTNVFSTMRQRNFNGEKWYVLLLHKCVRYPKFSKTLEDSPRILSRIVRQKIFIGDWWKPLPLFKIFRYPKFSETLKSSPTNVLALWAKKFLFYRWNFMKHWRHHFGIFWILRDKTFPIKPWWPALLYIKNFDAWYFLKHRTVLRRNFLIMSDSKFRTKRRDAPFS